jgi:hypothetical protein
LSLFKNLRLATKHKPTGTTLRNHSCVCRKTSFPSPEDYHRVWKRVSALEAKACWRYYGESSGCLVFLE